LVEDAGTVTVTLNPFGRKSSGSYYTPDELVKLIIEETLSPLVEDAMAKFAGLIKAKPDMAALQDADPANAILNLRIVDPAMGSGHFLVSLVDWLTDHVREAMEAAASDVDGYQSPLVARIAEIRTRIETEAETRKWPIIAAQLNNAQIIRRMVLKRCVYGVDLNPMAVELAKVSL
jgi:type II restriction/modification system DNA methylase subunit YeeA